MDLRIRLFGASTVVVDGDELPVAGPRQRTVLARLALAPGAAVSAERLLVDVWGDNLPRGGSKAVAFQITKLRDLVEPDRDGPGTVIATDAAGYRLAVTPDQIDIHRFDRLVTDARAALDDPHKARGLIDDALGLWRGAPLADLDEQTWVTDEIARLDGVRLVAERTLVQARMATGEHTEVIGHIEQLVRSHPLEEGLVADLMTALEASGRSAEALRAYGDLRRRLGDELGIAPSRALQRLELRILEGSGDELTSTSPTVASTDRAGNLPRLETTFVGREAELARLDETLASTPLVVLSGPGGSGKSRLALEYARRAQDRFEHGAWLVELAPVTDPALTMTAVGTTFGLRPGEAASMAEVVRRYLHSRRLLLVVDNCEHVLAAASEAIADILDAAPHVEIIATSRESLGLPGEVIVGVPPLDLPEVAPGVEATSSCSAIDLFLSRAAAIDPGIPATDDEAAAVARICVRVDGMPLGLELAAARLRTLTVVELADRLDESLRALSAAPKSAPDRHRTLHATVDWSYSLLTAEEQALFRCLSVFPTSFDLAAAQAVAADQVDEWELLSTLDSLVDKSLVTVAREGPSRTRYRLLVPVREFAHEQLADSGRQDDALLRHALHYAGLASEAAPHSRGPEQMEGQRWLALEHDNLRAALSRLLANDLVDEALDLGFDLHLHWMHAGFHVEAVESLLAALAARPEADVGRRLRAYWVIAVLGAEITDPRSVDHGRAGLELARATGDPNLEGRMELALGAALRHTTLDPSYLDHLTRGRRLLDAHPEPRWWDPIWEQGMINLICAAYFPPSDERSDEHTEVAIDSFDAVGDRAMHAAALAESGATYFQRDPGRAVVNAERSVELFEALSVPYWHGHALQSLGILQLMLGHPHDAHGHLARAAGYLIDCGDLSCWALSTGRMADCETATGELGAARHHLHQVLDELDDLPLAPIHRARALDTGAHLLLRLGQADAAATLLGCAEQAPYPETVARREPLHAILRALIEPRLGPDRLSDLTEVGAGLSVEGGLDLLIEQL